MNIWDFHKPLIEYTKNLIKAHYKGTLDVSEADGYATDAIVLAIDSKEDNVTFEKLQKYIRDVLRKDDLEYIPIRFGAKGEIEGGRGGSEKVVLVEHSKKCVSCKEDKPAYCFRINIRGSKQYVRNKCKSCSSKEYDGKYLKSNHEKRIKQRRKYTENLSDNYISRILKIQNKEVSVSSIIQKRREIIEYRKKEKKVKHYARKEYYILFEQGLKKCTLCAEIKPLSEFNKCTGGKCKPCFATIKKPYNSEKRPKQNRPAKNHIAPKGNFQIHLQWHSI